MVAIETFIRDIPDFPKPGIVFKDITPLLANPEALNFCLKQLKTLVGDQEIDKVVAIESRGFLFGTLLAKELEAGFVMVRKGGKLPYNTIKEPYTLEYGMDALEIHEDAIKPGDRVLLHDDVLATGGTAKAACNLIEQLGGKVVQCNFLIELEFLKGASKLQQYEQRSLLCY